MTLTAPALWLTGLERSLLLAGLSVALGGLAGRGLARQYLARQDTPALPAPLPEPWALRGSLAGLVASAALLVTALAGPGAAASLARPPVAGLGSRATAVIAAAELACFALAAILLRFRLSSWGVLPLLGVVLAEGIRAHPEGMIPAAGALLTYCHLLPAVLWAGMLVYTARAVIAWRASAESVRGLLRLYGTAAAWLFAVVVATGAASALLLVPAGSLLTTSYGRFLIAKAALVAVVTALALASRAGLRRPAEPGAGLPAAVRLEIGALAAVLAVTGILTVLTPPAKPVLSAAARQAAGPPAAGPPARQPPGRSAGQLADRVSGTDGSGHRDPGIQAAQPQLAADPGVDEPQGVRAEPGGELGAAEMRLRGDLDDRRAHRQPGAGRQVGRAQVEIDVELIPGQHAPAGLLGDEQGGAGIHHRQLHVRVR